MSGTGFDPLAASRTPSSPTYDVLLSGTVFLDIIFTGMTQMPAAGSEVMADGMGSSPGGIANLAVAASRLGLRTSLAAAFGDDVYADFCWDALAEQELVDLSRSRRFEGWHSPVTVSMAVHHDRSMVTHAHRPPVTATELIDDPPASRVVMVATPSATPTTRRGSTSPAPAARSSSPTSAGTPPRCGRPPSSTS